MFKKFDKVVTVVAGISLIVMIFTFKEMYFQEQHTNEVQAAEIMFPDEYVFEDYIITEIENDGQEIYGGVISSTAEIDTAEGIFLDPTVYEQFHHLKELKVGDKVRVTYDSEDYSEGCWDNLLNVENID